MVLERIHDLEIRLRNLESLPVIAEAKAKLAKEAEEIKAKADAEAEAEAKRKNDEAVAANQRAAVDAAASGQPRPAAHIPELIPAGKPKEN